MEVATVIQSGGNRFQCRGAGAGLGTLRFYRKVPGGSADLRVAGGGFADTGTDTALHHRGLGGIYIYILYLEEEEEYYCCISRISRISSKNIYPRSARGRVLRGVGPVQRPDDDRPRLRP
jgi:hypothetical protein